MAETESKTRRELLKYRIVCALSVAAQVARHHFSYFCEGGQP